MDKEMKEFIENEFCNVNKKIDIILAEIKEIKELQSKVIKGPSDLHENKRAVNLRSSNRKKTIIPNFKTKVDRMNEEALRLLKTK